MIRYQASEYRASECDPGVTDIDATQDSLLGGRVRLWQPRRGYRAAIDPVLLAAATEAAPGEQVLDLGAGVGAATFCLAARVPASRIMGLELQSELAELARRNIAANRAVGRVDIVQGDLLKPPPAVLPNSFDRIMANPPFLRSGAHCAPPDPGKAVAHGEGGADLAAWIDAAARLLRPKGWLTLIHRADRVDEILARMYGRFGTTTVFPLWPRPGGAARRVIVAARKGGKGPARIAAGLVLHDADGGFTPQAEAILRDGVPLSLT